MKCHFCGCDEAVLHIKEIIDGEQYEINICRKCEVEKNIIEKCLELEAHNLSNILEHYKHTPIKIKKNSSKEYEEKNCEYCGYALSEFLETNTLSCPKCYEAFKSYINKNIKKIHKSSKHIGKIANNNIKTKDIELEIYKYNNAIELLVENESYEEALILKNKVIELQNILTGKKNISERKDAN